MLDSNTSLKLLMFACKFDGICQQYIEISGSMAYYMLVAQQTWAVLISTWKLFIESSILHTRWRIRFDCISEIVTEKSHLLKLHYFMN